MTNYDFIHSLNLEELAFFLATTKIGIVKGTAERLGYEYEKLEEVEIELLEETKKFLEREVPSND